MPHSVSVAMSPRAARKRPATAVTGLLDGQAYVKIISVSLGEDVDSSTILWSLKIPFMVALHLFPKVPYTLVHQEMVSSDASYPRQFLSLGRSKEDYLDFGDDKEAAREIRAKFKEIDTHLSAVMKLHEELVVHGITPDIAAYALPISTYVTLEVNTSMGNIRALADIDPPAEDEISSFEENIYTAMINLGESHIALNWRRESNDSDSEEETSTSALSLFHESVVVTPSPADSGKQAKAEVVTTSKKIAPNMKSPEPEVILLRKQETPVVNSSFIEECSPCYEEKRGEVSDTDNERVILEQAAVPELDDASSDGTLIATAEIVTELETNSVSSPPLNDEETSQSIQVTENVSLQQEEAEAERVLPINTDATIATSLSDSTVIEAAPILLPATPVPASTSLVSPTPSPIIDPLTIHTPPSPTPIPPTPVAIPPSPTPVPPTTPPSSSPTPVPVPVPIPPTTPVIAPTPSPIPSSTPTPSPIPSSTPTPSPIPSSTPVIASTPSPVPPTPVIASTPSPVPPTPTPTIDNTEVVPVSSLEIVPITEKVEPPSATTVPASEQALPVSTPKTKRVVEKVEKRATPAKEEVSKSSEPKSPKKTVRIDEAGNTVRIIKETPSPKVRTLSPPRKSSSSSSSSSSTSSSSSSSTSSSSKSESSSPKKSSSSKSESSSPKKSSSSKSESSSRAASPRRIVMRDDDNEEVVVVSPRRHTKAVTKGDDTEEVVIVKKISPSRAKSSVTTPQPGRKPIRIVPSSPATKPSRMPK